MSLKVIFSIIILTPSLVLANEYPVFSYCGSLLSDADISVSDQPPSSTASLSSYLGELFESGVISRSDLEFFATELRAGRKPNPIEVENLDIQRTVAAERIEILLAEDVDIADLIRWTDMALATDQNISQVTQTIEEVTTNVDVLVETATGRDDILYLLDGFFSRPESISKRNLLNILIKEKINFDDSVQVQLLANTLRQDHWIQFGDLIEEVILSIPSESIAFFIEKFFKNPNPIQLQYRDLLISGLGRITRYNINDWPELLRGVLFNPIWTFDSESLRKIFYLTWNDLSRMWLDSFYINPYSDNYADFLFEILSTEKRSHYVFWDRFKSIVVTILQDRWVQHPEYLLRLASLEFSEKELETIQQRFDKCKLWSSHPDYQKIRSALEILDQNTRRDTLRSIFHLESQD